MPGSRMRCTGHGPIAGLKRLAAPGPVLAAFVTMRSASVNRRSKVGVAREVQLAMA